MDTRVPRTACLVIVLGVFATGCLQKVALYCDENTPCEDPARSYCDLMGAYDPDGVRNTCVPNPFDASVLPDPDGGVPDAQSDTDAAPRPAELGMTPNSQDFGSVVEGQASAIATFIVSNTGESSSGTLSASVTGAGSDQFNVSGSCVGATLDAAATCTVDVTFAPDGPAVNSASLEVMASPGGTVAASLAGEGLAVGDLSIGPTNQSFGSIALGSTSTPRTFTVENTGGSATGGLSVSLSNSDDFSVTSDNCSGNVLAASQTCTLSVAFDPDSVSSKLGSLLVSATPGGSASASLGGTGTADVTVSKTGSGASGGTVTSTPAGISCGSVCTASFSVSTVTLSATTSANTTFTGWSGSGCSGTGTCQLPMTAARTVTADFLAPPSCDGLVAACGASGNQSCCATTVVPGGTYYRSYDAASDAYNDMSYPATVDDFRLDTYEITVGRFRAFVEAGKGTQASPPVAGSGAHPQIAGSGWNASWNDSLAADTAALIAGLKYGNTTWTDTPGANERRPMSSLTWYEAFAFCIWDGGYLPTEAEWNYAAAGGGEQRAYPWSNPASATTIDSTYAVYNDGSGAAPFGEVGSKSPKGDGRWGQADLAGNVWEWTLDWRADPYVLPCDDCANLTVATNRVYRGGGYNSLASTPRTGNRRDGGPADRTFGTGARCARAP